MEMLLAGAAGVEDPAATAELEQRFAVLVTSHRERARRLAWRLLGGDDAASEDVIQEAFAKAYRGLGRFRGDSKLETWFYRILVRQVQNQRRWWAVRQRWSGAWRQDVPDPRPEAPGDPALRRRISEALERLSRGQREAFILIHLEGFTVGECADLLGKPTGTVKSHLHRALKKLRTELADLDGVVGVNGGAGK